MKRGGKAEANDAWDVQEPGRALRPSQCRRWLKKTLAANLPKLTRRFLADVTPRNCAHMKLVTELIDEPDRKVRGGSRSIDRLLRELGEEP